MEAVGTKEPEAERTAGVLKRNQVDWRHVAVIGVAGCGPAASIALNLPFMGQFAGASLVLAFALIWPAIILMVNTFIQFSKRIASAGGLYTWNARTWGSNVGFVYGWTLMGSYLLVAAGGFTMFGAFLSEYLLSEFSLNIPWWVLMGAAMAYVVTLAILGILQTLHATLLLLSIEVILLVALAIWILLKVGPSNWSATPFKLTGIEGVTASMFGLAMTFGLLSHVGIEEGTTLAEEAKEPKKNVPKGLIVTGLAVPAFYVLVSYGSVIGYGVDNIQAGFTEDPVPIQTLAADFWGSAGLMAIVFGASASILAFAQTSFTAGTRVLYALGRDRVLPAKLGETGSKGTPVAAVWAMLAISIAVAVPVAIAAGPFETWGYFGFMIGIAFLLSYIITNLAMVKFTYGTESFSVIRCGVFGVLGAVILCYPLYRSVLPLPEGVYGLLPFVYLGWVGIGVVMLLVARRNRPNEIARIGKALAADE